MDWEVENGVQVYLPPTPHDQGNYSDVVSGQVFSPDPSIVSFSPSYQVLLGTCRGVGSLQTPLYV